MDVLIYSAYQLFGECLERCLAPLEDVVVVAVVRQEAEARNVLDRVSVDLLLVDLASGIRDDRIAALRYDYPGLVPLALGLADEPSAVIRCGQAGFAGYVSNDASLQSLRARMQECVEGRLSCSDTVAATLLRALHRTDRGAPSPNRQNLSPVRPSPRLSTREIAVVGHLRRGLSNKEIARELVISVATVKHHVHSILEKLGLPGRVHVVRAEPDQSWGLDAQVKAPTVDAARRA